MRNMVKLTEDEVSNTPQYNCLQTRKLDVLLSQQELRTVRVHQHFSIHLVFGFEDSRMWPT